LTRDQRRSYTKWLIREPAISSLFSKLAESWHDPVLRHWRWQRLRGRVKPVAEAQALPGDAVAEGADLYLTGLGARDEDRAARGLRLLLGGVERGVGASGATLEGSTLRQAQLARVTAEVWLAARRARRPEQWRLASVARSIIGAYDALHLTGGLPQIGDRPEGFDSAAPFDQLDETDRNALDELRRQSKLYDLETLRRDGWLRLDKGPWSGLWYCPTSGWPAYEGLAHHDLGAAELHWNGLPLLVDPGAGKAAAVSHGGLTLDRQNPYPESRAGYSDAFRREIAGPAPELRTHLDGVKLTMDGFGRFGGHRQIERVWRFDGESLRIEDLILGTGRPLIERRLVTPWDVQRDDEGVILSQGEHRLRLVTEGTISLQPTYGPTQIIIAVRANLPWSGALTLEPVRA
jgi:hypothetical protein